MTVTPRKKNATDAGSFSVAEQKKKRYRKQRLWDMLYIKRPAHVIMSRLS
jgi:hypothetical protein